METWRWITSTRRKPRESATESKPPRTWFGVRVKGWGKSPPGLRRRGPHGKPRQEQDRIGGVYGPSSAYAPGVSHQACSNARRRGMTAEPERGNRTRLTGRLDILHSLRGPNHVHTIDTGIINDVSDLDDSSRGGLLLSLNDHRRLRVFSAYAFDA